MRVHPGARRERITGWRPDGALALEVTAPPDGGRANEAVERLLSAALGVPRGAVRVTGGHGSRSKWIEVAGLSADEIEARLATAGPRKEHERGE